MTTAAVAAILIATNAAIGLYAVGLLRRLHASELRRVEAERQRQEADAWADKWEVEVLTLVQELGALRRQYDALQARYARRTREMLIASRDIVAWNVALKQDGGE